MNRDGRHVRTADAGKRNKIVRGFSAAHGFNRFNLISIYTTFAVSSSTNIIARIITLIVFENSVPKNTLSMA